MLVGLHPSLTAVIGCQPLRRSLNQTSRLNMHERSRCSNVSSDWLQEAHAPLFGKQAVRLKPFRRPATSQQGQPSKEFGGGRRLGLVKLLGTQYTRLPDEEGLVRGGRQILVIHYHFHTNLSG
jgi:hypothetical protein